MCRGDELFGLAFNVNGEYQKMAFVIKKNKASSKCESVRGCLDSWKMKSFHFSVNRSGAFPHSTLTAPINDKRVTNLEKYGYLSKHFTVEAHNSRISLS